MKHFRLWIDEPADVWWVNSPVPKPSIPGISSPKLQTQKTVRYHGFMSYLDLWTREEWPTPGFPSLGACSWTDGSASAWTWEVLYVGWPDLHWHGWLIWSPLWAQGSFCLWLLEMPLWYVVVVIFTFGKRGKRESSHSIHLSKQFVLQLLSPLSDTPLPWSS